MPKGHHRKGKREIGREKKKDSSVLRQARKRERAASAYLKPNDPDFRSFSNQLAAQGLKLHDVPGDGNCLFHALAQQLGDRTMTHYTLRRDVIHYMRQHPEQFEPFVAEEEEEDDEKQSYEDYLSLLSNDGEYVGNDVIVAFTRAFSTNVIIHQLNTPRWEIMAPPTATPTSLKRPTLHIAYLNGEHYCTVLPLEPSNSLPSTHMEGLGSLETFGEVSTGGVTTAVKEGGRGGSALERVVTATGCEDRGLAEQILLENCYDVDMATVELLQLMDLGQDEKQTFTEQQKSKKTGPAKQPIPDRVHISNRLRKAQAKAERKEKRRQEQGAKQNKKTTANSSDPVGAMAI